MTYLIYNPLSDNNRGEEIKNQALEKLKDRYESIESVNGYDLNIDEFVKAVNKEDNIILVGGDGTLNRFANFIYGKGYENNFYFYRAGTGNDFINDVGPGDGVLVPLNEYLKKLPCLTVKGKKYYFVNGIGLGVDGLVCKMVNDLKGKQKKINYTLVAIKALVGKYKRTYAEVVIDDTTTLKHDNVWFVATMNGRYFGGGMKITPEQDRHSGLFSICFFHCKSVIKTLFLFTKIFKGKHVKYTKNVTILKGKKVEVKFASPKILQIDGETISDVDSYTVEY